jgi:prepilin-type N-terminal cleavage/methylation domain-containing protein
MKSQRGFTLIELIVGILLVTVVMSAALMLMSTMVQYQLKGSRQARVSGMTALNIETMLSDFRNATSIDASQTNNSTSIGGCDNWSAPSSYTPNSLSVNGIDVAGPLSNNPNDMIVCFHYWVDGDNNLWGTRYSATIGNGGHCPCTGSDPTQILSAGSFFAAPPVGSAALTCYPTGEGRPNFVVNMPLAQIEANFCVGTKAGTEGVIPSDLMVTTAFPINLGGG